MRPEGNDTNRTVEKKFTSVHLYWLVEAIYTGSRRVGDGSFFSLFGNGFPSTRVFARTACRDNGPRSIFKSMTMTHQVSLKIGRVRRSRETRRTRAAAALEKDADQHDDQHRDQ